MEENKREMFLHDWVVEEIKVQYYKEFNEIKINKFGVEDNEIDGLFPDVIFGNYGQIIMLGEVEVDSTINSESIKRWKMIQDLGISLIIFVPIVKLKIVRDMCWENKLIERVKVSSFSVDIPLK
ncbi:hypothetical protein HN460_01230 [bacterium]|jgi:hypothetical protein|nr:hypothetical protein [bacterium]MBT3795879.1 hypothetical protein [bacterium]MBT4634769.1 hypothetical protein [bacterium]